MTDRQRLFADNYLTNGFIAKDAAIAAGYSKKSAEAQSSQLLKNTKVAQYIDKRRRKIFDKYEVTEERLIAEMAKIAFSNIKNYVNGGNIPLELKFLEDDLTAAVQEVGVEERESKGSKTVNRKLKLYDKKAALVDLMKWKGMFEQDNIQRKPVVKIGFSDEEDDE